MVCAALAAVSGVLMIVSNIAYRLFLKYVRAEDAENGVTIDHPAAGYWSGNGYRARPPMPIIREGRNQNTIRVIAFHNKLVKLHWLIVLMIIIDIILMVVL